MMLFQRHPLNPLLSPAEVPPSHPGLKVLGAFNPGATHDGKNFRLLVRIAESAIANPDEIALPVLVPDEGRVSPRLEIRRWSKNDPRLDLSDARYIRYGKELHLSSISHLRLATSEDGIHFTLAESPFLFPSAPYELHGIEDARIVSMGQEWLINYTAVAPTGYTTALAATTDFQSVKRRGILFPPENKDVCLLPEQVGGFYHCLHRPLNTLYNRHAIWTSRSPDLMCWGHHQPVLLPRANGHEDARVGGGAPCLRTREGWLQIYHGASPAHRYSLFAALFDLEDPARLIARSREPVFEPEADYEREGFFGGVVFTNGLVRRGDSLYLYYGAADTSTCLAQGSLEELLSWLKRSS